MYFIKNLTNFKSCHGDWGLGIGDWAQSPIPNPPYPIPHPPTPIILFIF